MISINKLFKSFAKDWKYQKTKESIVTGIKACIQSWCNKNGITTTSFSEWKEAVILATYE